MSEPEDNNNLPRLFTEDRRSSKGERRSGKGRWAVVALTLTVLALGAVIWLGTAGNGPHGSVPTIVAAAGEYKTRPEDPGGRDIAHRDSTVFRALKDGDQTTPKQDSKQRVENLAAHDDNGGPLPEDRFYANLGAEVNNLADRRENKRQDENNTANGDGDLPEKPKRLAAGKNSDNKETLEFVREVLEKKDKIEQQQRHKNQDTANETPREKPQEKLNTKPGATGEAETASGEETQRESADQASQARGHYVQLGSFRKKSVARRAWQRASKKYGQALDGVTRNIERADLGERGTYYRTRGGPVTQARAGQICRIIKEQDKNGCLVVSPGK